MRAKKRDDERTMDETDEIGRNLMDQRHELKQYREGTHPHMLEFERRFDVLNKEHDEAMAARQEDLRIAREQRDERQREIERLREQISKDICTEQALSRERDGLRREVGRLKRVVKGLRDAFVAATEEDAPPANPFGSPPL